MKRSALLFLGLVAACGGDSGTGGGGSGGSGGSASGGSVAGRSGASGGAGSPGGAAGAGSSGSAAGSGGTSSGGATAGSGGSTAGGGGTNNPDAGAGKSGDAGATDTAPMPNAGYKCSMLIGPNVHGDWFDAGFETMVGTKRWQRKTPHHSFVEDWAMTAGPWAESNCPGTWGGCTTASRCEGNLPVDRVVFVTQTGKYIEYSQAMWESEIKRAIATIKSKHPMVRHVVLMTFVRGPNGTSCGGESNISPKLDAAHAALAAASNGEISVGPKLMVNACGDFAGIPYVKDNKPIGAQAAKFFLQLDGPP